MSAKPSYLGAFLKHPVNRVALLAAGVAAIFASIPFGLTGLALVGVVALGTEVLAALAVPSLPAFQAWADLEHQRGQRARRRIELLAELSNYGAPQAMATYQHMASRVQALYQTARDNRTSLTRQDVEKLEDLTVDYLGLCVVNLSLQQRKEQVSEDVVARRMAAVQAQLQSPGLPEAEERQLRSTLAEYSEVLQRARRLAVRRATLEATLISMPDKMEEVYQLVITSPYSSDMGDKLEDSLARLRIAEEVAAEFDTPERFGAAQNPTHAVPASARNPARPAATAAKT
ncbi:MAG: hypothetical protein K9K38_00915 [Rhodoferax sp.]|nr:hypothetical protein [Rhodoferax sp.]MCF8207962.1 hypothetical protein [Rhodoferax sp.]